MKQPLSQYGQSFSILALTKKLKYFWKKAMALITVKDRKEKRNQINYPQPRSGMHHLGTPVLLTNLLLAFTERN
jgi:hypothetical protein